MVWSRALFQSFTLRTYLDSVVGGGSADTVYRMMRPRVYAQCYVAYLLLTIPVWFVTMGQWRKVGTDTERPLCVCFGKEMLVITKAAIRGEWGQGYMVSHSRELHTPTLQNIKRFLWLLLLKNVCPFPVGQQIKRNGWHVQFEWN